MASQDVQQEIIKRQIKIEALTGMIGEKPFVPTQSFIDQEYENRIKAHGMQSSTFEPIIKNSKSDGDKLGDKIWDIVNDVDTMKKTIRAQREQVQKYFDTSKIEYERALKSLSSLNRESNLISAGIPADELSYAVGDSFNDTNKIDKLRSDILIDQEAGMVRLGDTKNFIVDLSHLRKENNPNIGIDIGLDAVQYRRSLPGCPFSNLFNGSEMDNWMYEIKTHTDSPVQIHFDIILTANGSAVRINRIDITSLASSGYDEIQRGQTTDKTEETLKEIGDFGSIWIEYCNANEDGIWKEIDTKDLRKKVIWNFNPVDVTTLRISMRKNIQDFNGKYVFSLSEINVYRSDTVYEGTLLSKSLEVKAYGTESPTVVSAALSTDATIPDGTEIKYYIATDEPVDGYFVDENGTELDAGSPNITGFQTSGIIDEYVFSSQLRDAGITGYDTWEPNWIEITPIEVSDDDGKKYIEFNNYVFRTADYNREIGTVKVGMWGSGYLGDGGVSGVLGTSWGEDDYLWGDFGSPGFWRPMVRSFDVDYYVNPIYDGDTVIPSRDLTSAGIIYVDNNPAEPDIRIMNKDYYKMFLIPSTVDIIPGSIKMTIRDIPPASGEYYHMWQFVKKDNYVWSQKTVYSDINTDNMEVIASGTYKQAIHVTASGLVEEGSVKDLKHKGGQIPYQQNYDYYVAYNGLSFDIDITPISYREKEQGTIDRAWQVSYKFRETIPEQSAWVSFIYNKKDIPINVPLNEHYKSTIAGFKVDYLDTAETTTRIPITVKELKFKPGWNKVYIYATVSPTPTDEELSVSFENIKNIFDTSSEAWNDMTSFISAGMAEVSFTEMTRSSSPDSYSLFSSIEDANGITWIVVPGLKSSNIHTSLFNVSDEHDKFYVFRNDAGILPDVYAIEFKEAKDKRKNRVMFKAVMKSSKESVSPELKSYMILLNDRALDVTKPSDIMNGSSIGTTNEI